MFSSSLPCRRDRRGAAVITDGDSADAEAYLVQVGIILRPVDFYA